MSRDFSNLDVNSEDGMAECRSFIARMERKLELKEAHSDGRDEF